MPTNNAATFSADVLNYLAEETLMLPVRQLVLYKIGDRLTIPQGRGTTYTAVRYERLPLPFAPLAEGVPPVGETMTVSTVTGTAQQWGDKVTLTDQAEDTIFHPPFQQAKNRAMLQMAEMLERNTSNTLSTGTQVNYVNARGSRSALQSADYLDATVLGRTNSMLLQIGAPRFNGDTQADTQLDPDNDQADASSPIRGHEHYMSVIHPYVENDLMNDNTIKVALQYSDIGRLYNGYIGEWSGMTFCRTNMLQTWTGIAQVNGSGGTAGTLATGTYYIKVTGQDTQNQYESAIYQVSASISVTGPNGSISVTVPSTAGFTYNVYVGTTTSPANLGLSTSGPTSGPLQGQATQIAPGTTAIITAVGQAQTPPAAPTTGITVYPTYVFGRGAYGQISIGADSVQWSYLTDADKADPLNQLRVVGYKLWYATMFLNQTFMCRIESTSSTTSTFG